MTTQRQATCDGIAVEVSAAAKHGLMHDRRMAARSLMPSPAAHTEDERRTPWGWAAGGSRSRPKRKQRRGAVPESPLRARLLILQYPSPAWTPNQLIKVKK